MITENVTQHATLRWLHFLKHLSDIPPQTKVHSVTVPFTTRVFFEPSEHCSKGERNNAIQPQLQHNAPEQLYRKIRPGLVKPNESCHPTQSSVAAAALQKMLNRLKDHREQRPQLCGAQTGELKTGPRAGNRTLERCRNAEHLRAIRTQCTVTPNVATVELSPAAIKLGSVQEFRTKDSYAELHPNLWSV